jgi:chromosome partitioning protein
MAHTVAFTHFKGGTGKTTSCLSVAGFLAKHGAKVLAIDLDPQGNLTSGLGVKKIKARKTMHHVMEGKSKLSSIIIKTPLENLDVAPASYHLAHSHNSPKGKNMSQILKNVLENYESDYDFVMLDLPPSHGHFIHNGIEAADVVVAVLDQGKFSGDGLELFQQYIDLLNKKNKSKYKIDHVIITKCPPGWNLFQKSRSKNAHKNAKFFSNNVYQIPYSEHILASQEKSIPISHYKPRSKVGLEYMKLASRLLES